MMEFDTILIKQFMLQRDKFSHILDLPKDKQILKHTNALMHEIIETERELNYKYWKQPVPIDWDKVKEEIVDQFIFFMNELNAVGMDSSELFSRTIKKQEVNKKRQEENY